MVPVKYYFIPALFVFHFCYARSQNIELKNILWGSEESKTIYIGVENKFIAAYHKNGQPSYQSNDMNIRLIGDTLVLYPRKAGKQMITASSDGMVTNISFDAYVLPPLHPELYVSAKGAKAQTTTDSIAIRLVSDQGSPIVDMLSIIACQLVIGKRTVEINNPILSSGIIAMAKEPDQQGKIIIKRIWIKNKHSGALISLDTNTNCSIPNCT